MKKEKRFTRETAWIYFKVWFKFSFWPIALLVLAHHLGMPTEIGLLIGALVLTCTTGGMLINLICYLWNIDIPKIL